MDTFFFDMTVRQAAWIIAILAFAQALPLLLAPAASRAGLLAFPRHQATAWILTAVDLMWVTWILLHGNLGPFDAVKPALYLIAPACFFLLINFLDELLAPRALGGLLLLAANPVLNAARWHDSDWRFVPIVLAYVWVVAGMLLVLSPYLFRRWALPWTAGDCRIRLAGTALLLLALLLGVLAFMVF